MDDDEKRAASEQWEPPPGYKWTKQLSPADRVALARMLGHIENGQADQRDRHVRRNRRRLGWATVAMIPLALAAVALPGRWAWSAIVPVIAFWTGVAVLYGSRP